MPMDREPTGVVTIDGVTHFTAWFDADSGRWSDLVVFCTQNLAPVSTRAKLAVGEAISCIACLAAR